MLGGAAARHRQARATRRQAEPDGGVSFHRRSGRRQDGAQAMRALATPQMTTSRSWSTCICGSTATAMGNGPTLRAAMSPTPGPYCHYGCNAGARRPHDPQQAPGRAVAGQLRPAGRADRGAGRPGDLDGCAPTWTATRSSAVLDIPAGPQVARGVALLEGAAWLERGPLSTEEATNRAAVLRKPRGNR